MNPEQLGDYLKRFESISETRMIPGLPIVARLDGRAFSTYTSSLKRPFEPWLCEAMQETAKALVKEFRPEIGYTQSDEITLLFKPVALASQDPRAKGELLFNGRVQKLTSLLSGYASSFFAMQASGKHPNPTRIPHFDCRVFQCPSEYDAALALVWRQDDAVKNSVSMLAQSVFSHKQLHGKNSRDMHEMLHEKGINWNDQPAHFKSGSFFRRVKVMADVSTFDHLGDRKPIAPVCRTVVSEVSLPRLRRVENLVGVVFRGEEPVMRTEPNGSNP